MKFPRFLISVMILAVAALAVPSVRADAIDAGKAVDLTATADGTQPFTYVWSKSGTVITGATAATLTIANFKASDVGLYSVTISNSAGSVSAAVTLTQTVIAPSNPHIGVVQRIVAFLKKLLPWNWA